MAEIYFNRLVDHPKLLVDMLEFASREWVDYSKYSVENVYLFGSRLHGVASRSSDYDFIVLVSGVYYPGPQMISDDLFNINLYHVDYWRQLLDENVCWVLVTNWFPDKYKLRENIKFALHIKKINLKKTILMDAGHNWMKGKRVWKEGDRHKAKKNVVHAMRWLEFGLQIIENGKVEDFTKGNEYWEWIYGKGDSITWDEIENYIKPLYTALAQKLTHVCTPKELPASKKPQHGLWTLDYIHEYGLEALNHELAINIRRHKEFPNLIGLSWDNVNSPPEMKVVQECGGLILDEQNNYEIVAYPYNLFFSYNEKHRAQVDFKNCKVYEKVDGILCILYFYNGKWHMASQTSPDGSEEVTSVVTPDNKYYYKSKKLMYNAWRFFSDDILQDHRQATFLSNTPEDTYFANFGDHVSGREDCVELKTVARDFFWSLFKSRDYKLPPTPTDESPKFCYMFELVSEKLALTLSRGRLYDGVSCDKKEVTSELNQSMINDKLLFHGARNLESMKEVPMTEIAPLYNWETVQTLENVWDYPGFPSLDSIIQYSRFLNPMICKGFVVVDTKQFTRVKVKSEQYTALKKLCWFAENKNSVRKAMLSIIVSNACTDFLTRFGQFKSIYQEALEEYENCTGTIWQEYEKIRYLPLYYKPAHVHRNLSNIEEFKKAVESISFAPTLFAFRNQGIMTEFDTRRIYFAMPQRIFLQILEQVKEWQT